MYGVLYGAFRLCISSPGYHHGYMCYMYKFAVCKVIIRIHEFSIYWGVQTLLKKKSKQWQHTVRCSVSAKIRGCVSVSAKIRRGARRQCPLLNSPLVMKDSVGMQISGNNVWMHRYSFVHLINGRALQFTLLCQILIFGISWSFQHICRNITKHPILNFV